MNSDADNSDNGGNLNDGSGGIVLDSSITSNDDSNNQQDREMPGNNGDPPLDSPEQDAANFRDIGDNIIQQKEDIMSINTQSLLNNGDGDSNHLDELLTTALASATTTDHHSAKQYAPSAAILPPPTTDNAQPAAAISAESHQNNEINQVVSVVQAEGSNQDTHAAIHESLRSLPGAFRITPNHSRPSSRQSNNNAAGGSDPHNPSIDEEVGALGLEEEAVLELDQSTDLCRVPSAYLVEETETEEIEIAEAKQVKPFFQRREGQLTVIIVGLLVASVAILLGVFLTRDQGGSSGDAAVNVLLPSEAPTLPPTFDPRPTLAIVRDQGVVNCGIDDLRAGDINLNEFNIDQCRAVAATIFGDPTKINLVIVGKDRYEKLLGREVDVLFAGVPFTLENLIREPTTGESFALGYPYYGAEFVYFGLEMYVNCVNEQKRHDECEDLSICAVDTPEIQSSIKASFPAAFLRFGPFSEMESSLKKGTCNVLVSDTYRIYGSTLQDDYSNGTYIMSDNYISRNLLSSVVRGDEQQWFDIVEGSRTVAHRAAQVGISKGACPTNSTDNEISFYNVPLCVGNIREIHEETMSQYVVSFGQNAKLTSVDAPNFASLECDDCKEVLEHNRPKQIKERGVFNCAVFMDPKYNLTMTSLPTLVSTKFCEILSVAIFQGDTDAVNITYIDTMDKSAFPLEFDAVAGVDYEEKYALNFDNMDFLGKMLPSLPYYYHDKFLYNGTLYDGTGSALAIVFDKEDRALDSIAIAVITAVVYAQRQGITRATYDKMPLIHLLGDSLTFMLRDVVSYAGNYDDIINEALALSDGAVDRGWNSVILSSAPAAKVPIFYCDFTGSCGDQCAWSEEFTIFFC